MVHGRTLGGMGRGCWLSVVERVELTANIVVAL